MQVPSVYGAPSGATGKREGTQGGPGIAAGPPGSPGEAGHDDQPLTLGEVLDELAFARAWRAERADAVELAGLGDSRPEEQ
jgi:hypothetical protein